MTVLIGAIAGASALSGCTSTAKTAKPSLAEASPAVVTADAGYTIPLPQTVSVLPEASGLAPAPAAQAASGQPLDAAATASYAGSTPQSAKPLLLASAEAAPQPLATTEGGVYGQPVASAVQPAMATLGVSQPLKPEQPAKAVSTETAASARATLPVASQMFPTAPALPTETAAAEGTVQLAYAGPVPFYLAPAPMRPLASKNAFGDTKAPRGRGDIERLIEKYSALYEVPVELVRHVVNRESTFNPRAYNHGYLGLMQIDHRTARGMGYQGSPSGLFDAETNLKYAVKYLKGAWLVAGRDQKRADWLYQTGYYYEAKRKGMLEITGLGIDRKRHRMAEDDGATLDPEGIVHQPKLPVGNTPPELRSPGA